MDRIGQVIIMSNKLEKVSMNGRMAYVIMCVEKYLVTMYPDRSWSFIADHMWRATSTNWGDWPDEYCVLIPDVLLTYEKYDETELSLYLTEEEYSELKALYSGITEGIEDDPSDELNYMLNKPYEMAMVYEGSGIGDGEESFAIIDEAEGILKSHNIELPDYNKILFSSSDELNGWGNDFDGRYLSIILNPAE